MSKARFPEGSLLAALSGEGTPADLRRAARRLRAEAAPAVAVEEEVAALARGLAASEVSRSPAVPDALPPLFWVEARRAEEDGRLGWVVERRGAGLAIRGFGMGADPRAVPEPRGTATLAFGGRPQPEDGDMLLARGLIAAVALPEVLAQMGEAAPILVLPADPGAAEAALLRGIRLSVAIPPEAAPG